MARLKKTVVMVGMMGAGKTAVGTMLARLLGVPFLDSDEEITRAANRPISEIFERDGEPFFRARETEVLARLLRGERFWQAHREHLYQWLVRAGASHARVSLGYLAWNLLVALPALLVGRGLPADRQWLLAGAVLGGAALAWVLVRLPLARRLRREGGHGRAA